MKLYNVAVVGATGLVGRKMIQVLEERNFPVNKLIPLASERSEGKEILFKNHAIPVQHLRPDAFRSVDIALFSAGASVSREFAPEAVKRNTIVIDNSSAFRMDPKVPLIVPEVNRRVTFRHSGIIANPNCSTIQMVVVLKPLYEAYGIHRVVVSTYQSVTGAGQKGVDQLQHESQNQSVPKPAFPHRILHNCIPHIDNFLEDGNTKEEWKMVVETKKIMQDESIEVSATCVRIPVMGGHSESVNVELKKRYEIQDIRELLSNAEGIKVMDDPGQNVYPMPVDANERDEVFVGRIRRDTSVKNGLNLWIVSDNLRKGAATNAVQIAEVLAIGR
jgi:aspartate-semialdehyde dehydrogenase